MEEWKQWKWKEESNGHEIILAEYSKTDDGERVIEDYYLIDLVNHEVIDEIFDSTPKEGCKQMINELALIDVILLPQGKTPNFLE